MNREGTSGLKYNCSWDPGLNHFTISALMQSALEFAWLAMSSQWWPKRKDWLFASDVPPVHAHLFKYKPPPPLYDFIQIVQLGKTGKEAEDNWQGR